ncbi:30S ribosomal protein S5 [Candidatus Nomurabacteria bacterium]|nr:30S ribosomal protein S5 [Candidatus Nomurabacteria bacterium]
MSDETQAQTHTEQQSSEAHKTSAPVENTPKEGQQNTPRRATKRNFRSKAPRRTRERVQPEFEQKIISLRRVTRVMAGGRRFSFSVGMVIGDKRGRVGFGLAKANDTSQAIQKAVNIAKQNLIKIQLTDDFSLPYSVSAKYKAARVELSPNFGRGLVSGSSVRTVLEFAGIKDVTSRVLSRSRNQLNNAKAAMKALEPFVVARGAAAQKKQETKKPATSGRDTKKS